MIKNPMRQMQDQLRAERRERNAMYLNGQRLDTRAQKVLRSQGITQAALDALHNGHVLVFARDSDRDNQFWILAMPKDTHWEWAEKRGHFCDYNVGKPTFTVLVSWCTVAYMRHEQTFPNRCRLWEDTDHFWIACNR